MAYRAVVIATSDYSELDFLVITQSRPETDIPEKVSLSVNSVNMTLFDFLIK